MQYLLINSYNDRLMTGYRQVADDKAYLAVVARKCMFWENVGLVADAKNKVKVLKALSQERLDHRSIVRLCGLESSNTRRTLRQLCTSGLVRCLTPVRWRVKIYEITEAGTGVLEVSLRLRKNSAFDQEMLMNG